jgi:PBP1b-binding outer membrane lipoprotein LpoB
MKKLPLYLYFLIAILAFFATGCANKTAAGTSSATDSGSASTQVGSINSSSTNSQEISTDTMFQLAMGTMLLEGSEMAIQPEQAAKLLPLWQVYQNLIDSETAAQVEIDAIEKQIEVSMLPEQIEAINGMEINEESLNELFENLGLEFGFGGRMGAQGRFL